MCFTDLGMVICIRLFHFKIKPIFATAPAASKNDAHYQSGQYWLKNNHLASLM